MSNGSKPAPKKGAATKKTSSAGNTRSRPGASWRSPASAPPPVKPPRDGRVHVRVLVDGRRKVLMHFENDAAYQAYLNRPKQG
jgi:hypothetical protein